jgi:tmRNA-binding protein
MKQEQNKRLKDAIQDMDKVVATMPLHAKLNRAWAEVKAAIAKTRKTDDSQQDNLFPGE